MKLSYMTPLPFNLCPVQGGPHLILPLLPEVRPCGEFYVAVFSVSWSLCRIYHFGPTFKPLSTGWGRGNYIDTNLSKV